MKTPLPVLVEGEPPEQRFWKFVRWCIVNNDPPLPKEWTEKKAKKKTKRKK
jgi:hypothetical protein